jgi:hypothetical protein
MRNAFETSGTSPSKPDFRVDNHGSISLLQPLEKRRRMGVGAFDSRTGLPG